MNKKFVFYILIILCFFFAVLNTAFSQDSSTVSPEAVQTVSEEGVASTGTNNEEAAAAVAAMDTRNALDFTTETLDGGTFTFSKAFGGKPSVLIFWCTWNADCATTLSELEPLVQEFGDKVNFIAVNCSETRDVVEPFVASQGFTGVVCLETDYNVSSLYDVYGMPQLVLVNKDGTIALRNTGMLPATRFKRFIASMLKK